MKSAFALLVAVALLTGAASAQTLTTTFAGGNGQSGNQFDLVAVNDLTICSFDINVDPGTWDVEIYTLPSGMPYLPNWNVPAAWTMIASVNGITSAGTGVPTQVSATLGVDIPAGVTQAFYVTVTNGTAINYTNGTTTGNLFASDANLNFYEGGGLSYPFGSNFNPRVWNGNIHYMLGLGGACGPILAEWQPNSPESTLDIDGGQYAANCAGVPFTLNSSTSNGVVAYDIGLNMSPIVPLSSGGTATGASQTVNLDLAGGLTLLFTDTTGSFGLHPGAFAAPFSLGGPAAILSGQQAVANPGGPDGLALSQAVQAETGPNPLALSLGDDNNINVSLAAAPLCFPGSVSFYGAAWTDLFVNSNGDVSFGGGHNDFSATVGEWETSAFGRIGAQCDLSPNASGSVTVTEAAGVVTVSYVAVGQYPGVGTPTQTCSIAFDTNTGDAFMSLIQDVGFGDPTVAGISNGAAGTHPGAGAANISFDVARGGGILPGVIGQSWMDAAGGPTVNTAGTPFLVDFFGTDGSGINVN
ncbi:MAG: hypothetical protein CMJ83_00555 [Planctomycetes bacterium]|nr:hypothetical protein [Planctomycetota bacterium]